MIDDYIDARSLTSIFQLAHQTPGKNSAPTGFSSPDTHRACLIRLQVKSDEHLAEHELSSDGKFSVEGIRDRCFGPRVGADLAAAAFRG